MLPLTFNRQILSSLPLVDEGDARAVGSLLRAIMVRRVLPYFKGGDAVDPSRLGTVADRMVVARLEDLEGELRFVSLVTVDDRSWTVHVHERIFDLLAFGLPEDPDARLGSANPEARKILALAELLLRHEVDHALKPQRDEEMVIRADARFAIERRAHDPAFYQALREALSDATNGIDGARYLELFDRSEKGGSVDGLLTSMVDEQVRALVAAPQPLLRGAFPAMSTGFKVRVLDALFAATRDDGRPVARRARAMDALIELLGEERKRDLGGLRLLFDGLVARWGVAPLLLELDIEPGAAARPDQAFGLLVSRLEARRRSRERAPGGQVPSLRQATAPLAGDRPEARPLKERIEQARQDPRIPRSVLEIIDRNASNLSGHSKPKYAELIETLLAVPWGELHAIDVGPREFAAGLERSHHGIEDAKELVADFFSNLIWRYRAFEPERAGEWHRTGSAFLFVGPPGVGKTSLAISIARNLGIPWHKVSLGGMRDESDLRGHGFTYEGSKPGAIVQGLIKMGAMNGMFILDEADKTESFAIATLLEILDPEQNHLFHDKYVQTAVDIDLSNCHFVLTANTLETVPAPVVDRCQVVRLGRYSVDEKVAIARRHVLPKLRSQHDIPEGAVVLQPGREDELLRFLIQRFTHEAGVRQLELVLRTLLLRVHRHEILEGGRTRVVVDRRVVHRLLDEPVRPRAINDADRVGEVLGVGVDAERGVGAVIPIQATRIPGATGESSAVSMVHATGNLEKVMDESRKVATTGILHCAAELGLDPSRVTSPVHLHFMGASTRKDGPSAGVAIALALASLLQDRPLRRDVAVTGEVDTQGRVQGVGGLDVKVETAIDAGCTTLVIPHENLDGPDGVGRFPEALKRELQVLDFATWRSGTQPFDHERHRLQVVGVRHLLEAHEVAVVDAADLEGPTRRVVEVAERVVEEGDASADRRCPPVVVVKAAESIDSEHFLGALCAGCSGCSVLAPRDQRPVLEAAVDEAHAPARWVEYDLRPGGLRRRVEELLRSDSVVGGDPQHTVIAPYFVLREDGMDARWAASRGVRLVADNYSAQGLKLTGCRPLLARLWCRLLHLGPAAIEWCPLVTSLDGVWVADLGLIPEKYRLLPARAEELLDRMVAAWLEVVESELAEPPVVAR